MTVIELRVPTAGQCTELMGDLALHADTCRRWLKAGETLDDTELADTLREDIREARELAERLDEHAPELAIKYGDRLRGAADRAEAVLTGKPSNPKPATTTNGYRIGDGDRIPALDFLREILGLPVTGVVQYGTELDAEYDLTLTDGRTIRLGTALDLRKQDRPCAAIMAGASVYVPRLKIPEWDMVGRAIVELAKVVDIGAQQDAETRAWLASFFASRGVRVDEHDRDAWAEALAGRDDDYSGTRARAIIGTDRLYVHLDTFHAFVVTVHRTARLSPAQMSTRIARLGFTRRRETARPSSGGTQQRRTLWHSPEGFTLDGDHSEAGS